MTAHDFAVFLALLASGVIGALVSTPVRAAIIVSSKRNRPNRRR